MTTSAVADLLLAHAISEPGMLCSVADAWARLMNGWARDASRAITPDELIAIDRKVIRRAFEVLVKRGDAMRCRRETQAGGRMTRRGVVYERLARS